jgi:hypothetical protein
LAASLKDRFGEDAQIKAGKSGQFDVIVGDRLVFSKAETGRFPVEDEVEEIFEAIRDGKEPPKPAPAKPGFVGRMIDKLRN